jgi:hypothetical protein
MARYRGSWCHCPLPARSGSLDPPRCHRPHPSRARSTPTPAITVADLDHLITTAAAATTFTTPPHPRQPGGWLITWGSQLDIRPVSFTGELTDITAAGYLAKYATKSTESTGHLSARITADTINDYRALATHTARLIVTCWNLGHRPDHEHPQHWKTTYGRLRTGLTCWVMADTTPPNPVATPPPAPR